MDVSDADKLRSEINSWIEKCLKQVLDSSLKPDRWKAFGALIELEGIIDAYFLRKRRRH